jgi:uncharacterized membrane-anchored protein
MVPEVTLLFWIIKIAATTLGETGGDALSMPPIELGYQIATYIYLAFFVVTVAAQIAAKGYNRFLYWAVIVATTLLGTTTADWMTRDMHVFGYVGLGYGRTSLALFTGLLVVLVVWHFSVGSVAINKIATRKAETFYWIAILVSNTLGTALGDWIADTQGVGFAGGALIFAGAIVVIGCLYLFTKINRPALFWSAFILTRPLGATLGDILTKPFHQGGLNLSRPASSLVILAAIIPLVWFFSKEPELPQAEEV